MTFLLLGCKFRRGGASNGYRTMHLNVHVTPHYFRSRKHHAFSSQSPSIFEIQQWVCVWLAGGWHGCGCKNHGTPSLACPSQAQKHRIRENTGISMGKGFTVALVVIRLCSIQTQNLIRTRVGPVFGRRLQQKMCIIQLITVLVWRVQQ